MEVVRVPTSPEVEYCAENPSDPQMPMVVTGHDALYAWTCQGGRPVITGQRYHSDDRGFIKEVWYEIQRP